LAQATPTSPQSGNPSGGGTAMAVAAASKASRPRPASRRRLLAGALLVVVGLRLLAAASSFVAPSGSSAAPITVSRGRGLRPLHRDRHAALSARGGGEDDAYEFVPAEVTTALLKQGQQFSGIVTKVMNFGAFVDIGADRDGLVPRSKLQKGFTENTADVVKEGQAVTVWVVENGDKLTLSMVQSKAMPFQPRADLSLFEGIDSSEWLTGVVNDIKPFGAFVSIKPPSGGEAVAQGLVHLTQIKDSYVENVEDEVTVGQEVKVRILSVDSAANKIALSMKEEGGGAGGAKGGPPDVSGFDTVTDADWLPGVVKSLVNFGAFVEVTPPDGPPAQGLLHISQIKEGFIEDPGEELEVDQEVKVRVMEVNPETGKLSLSMREKAAAME